MIWKAFLLKPCEKTLPGPLMRLCSSSLFLLGEALGSLFHQGAVGSEAKEESCVSGGRQKMKLTNHRSVQAYTMVIIMMKHLHFSTSLPRFSV